MSSNRPNKSLERTRAKYSAKLKRRRARRSAQPLDVIRALAIAAVTMTLAAACACKGDWAYFPDTLPFALPNVKPGEHLSESQAIDLAKWVSVYHRRNPANYAAPTASFNAGQWSIYFRPPSPEAFGTDFAVYIYERTNRFSLSPGR
jgi:hypothetical protein